MSRAPAPRPKSEAVPAPPVGGSILGGGGGIMGGGGGIMGGGGGALGGQGALAVMSPDLDAAPAGHGSALASVPPALAVAFPFSDWEKTSSLILASTGCPKAAGAGATTVTTTTAVTT